MTVTIIKELESQINNYNNIVSQYNYDITIKIINFLISDEWSLSTKNLKERKILLFLTIWLTGLNLDYLLHFKKYNLRELFQLTNQKTNKIDNQESNKENSNYLITNVTYNTDNSLNYTKKSEVFLISFRNSLINNLESDGKMKDLIDKLNDLYIFKEEYYTKKGEKDYIFSPLNTDKQKLTKSNGIKEMNEILNLLKTNNILSKETILNNLFTIR